MDFMLNFEPKKLDKPITYRDRIMLLGSCFTEHIGTALQDAKFSILQNPHGILFDPVSVTASLEVYIQNRKYSKEDLFMLNEVWHSWQHHSRFSSTSMDECLNRINSSRQDAYEFLKKTDWLIITLGTSFSYRLTEEARKNGAFNAAEGIHSVANCHRAPANWFTKHLLSIAEIVEIFDHCLDQLFAFNPGLRIIFTISPVRHIRDGVVENNRSKARLLETVHHLIEKYDCLHYFPAYEMVIDILRDYRFYDIDLVHPNYLATDYVLRKFAACCLNEDTSKLMEEVKKITLARRHKAFQPDTHAHRQFLKSSLEKAEELMKKYPFLDLKDELEYFNS